MTLSFVLILMMTLENKLCRIILTDWMLMFTMAKDGYHQHHHHDVKMLLFLNSFLQSHSSVFPCGSIDSILWTKLFWLEGMKSIVDKRWHSTKLEMCAVRHIFSTHSPLWSTWRAQIGGLFRFGHRDGCFWCSGNCLQNVTRMQIWRLKARLDRLSSN